jgi:hypothetical protein
VKSPEYPRIHASRDVERGRQRILLMALNTDQVRRLLAFYESAEGRRWSDRLVRAYEERMRMIASQIATAYVNAVKRRGE